MPTARRLNSHRGWVVDWLSFLIQVILIFHVQTAQSVGEGSKAIDLLGMQAVTLPVDFLSQTFSSIFWTDVFISKQCPTRAFPSPRFPNSSQASLTSCTQLSTPVDHKHSARLFLIGRPPWLLNMKFCLL